MASLDEQKQMDLLFLFFLLVLGSTLSSFLPVRQEGGTVGLLKLIVQPVSSVRIVRGGGINLSKEELFMSLSIHRLFTCARRVCMHRALSWRVLPDWMM